MNVKRIAFFAAAAALAGLLSAARPADASGNQDYQSLVRPDAVEQLVREFAAIESRLTGTEGAARAASIVRRHFEGLGLDPLVHTFSLPVPVQHYARIRLAGGREIPLQALWPNLSRTSSVHRDGLEGHLAYVGRGEFKDFDGLDLEDCIAVMEFDSADNMINARMMGARAVIFLEPETAYRYEGERKWLDSPADIPRFWVSREDGEALAALGREYRDRRREALAPFEEDRLRLRSQLTEARVAVEEATEEGRPRAERAELQEEAEALEKRVEAYRARRLAAADAVPKSNGRIFARVLWGEVEGENLWAYLPGAEERAWLERYSDAIGALRSALEPGVVEEGGPDVLLRVGAEALARGTAEEPAPEDQLAWLEKADLWAQVASAAGAVLETRAGEVARDPRPRQEDEIAKAQAALAALESMAVRALARDDEQWHEDFTEANLSLRDATEEWDEAPRIHLASQRLRAAAAAKPKHQVAILQAHYDSISVVPTLAPGAEQSLGLATMLELANVFAQRPPKRSVIFLATSGHAQTMRGMAAWLYAHCLPETAARRMTLPEFAELIREDEQIVFDILVGLDMSSGSRRMGVFHEGHASKYLTVTRPQAQPFFRAYGSLLANLSREVQAEGDMAEFERALEDAGLPELSDSARVVLRHIATREDSFDLRGLEHRLGRRMGDGAPPREDIIAALRIGLDHGLIRRRDPDVPDTGELAAMLRTAVEALARGTAEDPDPDDQLTWVEQADLWAQAATAAAETLETGLAHAELVYDADPRIQNGVTAIRGVVWTSLLPSYRAFDAEMCSMMGLPGVTLATINDTRQLVDTPHDTPDRMDFQNVRDQVELAAAVLGRAFDQTRRYSEARVRLANETRSFRGQITEFRLGKSVLADFPVPDVIVSARTGQRGVIRDYERYKSMTGVRTSLKAITDHRGHYFLPQVFFRNLRIEPLRYDLDTARLAYAADRGTQGSYYALEFPMDQVQKRWRNVVFFCESLDIYGADDPRYLRELNEIAVLGPLDFAPTTYGHSWPTGRSQTVYFQPDDRVKVLMGSGIFGRQFLLTRAVTAEEAAAGEIPEAREYQPTGVGYSSRDERGRRVSAIFRTPERVVRDTLILNQWRMDTLRSHGIENRLLATLQSKARRHYSEAVDDRLDMDFDRYADQLRGARGFAARAYPDVMGTATDTIRGLVFYFALLIPFSVFCERMLFAATDIRKRIVGVVTVFVLVFFVLYLAHPAFRIAQNPWIIFIAFVLMAMSVFVSSIVVTKFNEQIAHLRRTASDVHETDVGRLSASFAAFNLGINNMRKRKVRTALTTATIVLLMFTVLSFTSVETYTSFNEIPVVQARATYPGALLRDRNWNAMTDVAWRYVTSAFGETARAMVPRAWFVSVDRDSELHLRIEDADGTRSTFARGAVGLTPQEPLATGMDRALLPGHRWFEEGDEYVCVIAQGMAERLGIDPAAVAGQNGERPAVNAFGRRLTVIGILDAGQLDDAMDLDGGSVTPVDTTDVASRAAFGQEETVATVRENPTEIGTFRHIPLDHAIFVPFDFLRRSGGTLRSVAMVRPEDMGQEEFVDGIKEFMQRVGMTIFVSNPEDDTVTALSSLALSSFSGLQGLFIPIAIAALIVLNTMMGSVYERFKEIGIYSSVGLAPVHIAALFIAESCVYAVLGAILGYLLGQVVGAALFRLDLLGGMTLNYSSLSAVMSTVVVMAVVILSSLYPSKVASNMAVPDVTRRWKFPDPEGDDWVFDFPFTVASDHALGLYVFLHHYFEGYTEESVGSFYTDRVSFGSRGGEYGTGYLLRMMVWLAPFDMGVSQWVEMHAIMTEDPGIARIQVNIHRETGEVSAWKRLNKGFLTDIRKQFLVWRTIPNDVKARYAEEGRDHLAHLTEAEGEPART